MRNDPLAEPKDDRFPHITITGGPDPTSIHVFRDGREMKSVIEFQINGGSETPVTAIFKEFISFDGSVDVFPSRKLD